MSIHSRYNARFWIVTLSALMGAGMTLALGFWQLDRAAQKEKLSIERQNSQPIKLFGHWDAGSTQYLDNRQMNAKQGFFVITPLVTSSAAYVLVQRGWIPRNFINRTKLEPIETPTGKVAIEARVVTHRTAPAFFAKETASEHPIVAAIDFSAFSQALPDRAYSGMVQQVGLASEGLLREWYEPASGVDKHYGYALQWFAMSVTILGMYLWLQWLGPKLMQRI